MGSSDSLSLPSEPPDVGKWFSSYVYESPELNTIDDFKDSGGSRAAEIGDGQIVREENFEGKNIWKKDGLPPDVKGTSNGFLKCKNLAGDNNCESEVMEYSDSLSLVSEPPDVKNWFSSYVYESPSIDTGYEFRSNCKEDDVDEEVNDATNCSQGKKVDSINPIEKVKRKDLGGQTTTSSGLVKCVNIVGDEDSEHQCFPKVSNWRDFQKADGSQNSGTLNHLVTKRIHNQSLQQKIMQDQDLDSVKDFEQSLLSAESSVDNLNSRFSEEAGHMLDNKAVIKARKSPQNSIYRRELADESWVAKDCRKAMDIVLPATKSEINLVDGKPVKGTGRHGDKENKNKENDSNEFGENGFISTRSKKVGHENSSKRAVQVKSDFMIQLRGNEEAITRTALSETTNFLSSNVLEITGKWRCPQKSKPNLGPPLKQLRLEQWVRRV